MSRRTLLILVALAGLVVAGGLVGVVVATSGGGDQLTVFTARSHYGDEKPFQDFAKDEGVDLTLFGGSASELYERLKSEGDETKADLLITVDAANLWRAQEAGLIERVVRTDRSRPHDHALHRAGEGDRRHHLRGPRRPALEGQAVPALGHLGVQRLVRRRPDREGRRGRDAGDARALDGQRARDPRLRRRRAERDRGRPLRRRASPTPTTSAASWRRTRTSRSRRYGPTSRAAERT